MSKTEKRDSCRCKSCVSCCETFPGWMNPEDAMKAIESGYGDRLMLDWLYADADEGFENDVEVLTPASVGYESRKAPEMPSLGVFFGWDKGRCTFLSRGKLCQIHDSGFKPQQCRETIACEDKGPDNFVMAQLWNTECGRATVASWKSQFLKEAA